MGMKPRKKPEKSKMLDMTDIENVKQVAGEFAGLLIWCLKFTKFPDGLMFNPSTGEMTKIEERIFDSLDKIGHVVNRDKYYLERGKKG